jgi:ABC-type transport system involved in multi-copper enzyme maturation permease subunit
MIAPLMTSAPAPAVGSDIAPIPFSRLLRVEWSKATDTRAARWLIGLVGIATVAVMLAPLLARGSIDQNYVTYLSFAAIPLTVLLPVVSILTLTSEWSQRTVLTTFVQEPRRSRVVNAKVTVSAIIALAAAAFGGAVTALAVSIAALSGRPVEANLHPAELIGFVLFVLLNLMMGVAFGALLHNPAAAIVLFFGLPTVFGIVGSLVKSIGQWLDPSRTFDWVLNGDWDGHVAKIAVSGLVWLVMPLAAGIVRTVRREIK